MGKRSPKRSLMGQAARTLACPFQIEDYSSGRPAGAAGSCAAGSEIPGFPVESGRLSVPGLSGAGRASVPCARESVGAAIPSCAVEAGAAALPSPFALKLAGSLFGWSAVFGIAGCKGVASVEVGA